MSKSSAPPVFISYARGTSSVEARALKEALGEDAFLDTSEIRVGSDFVQSITEALFGARVVVAFVDSQYFSRWYCLKEWSIALAAWRHNLRGADQAAITEALSPVFVAVTKDAAWRRVPPEIKTKDWPQTEETERISTLVLERLEGQSETIGSRLESLGIADQIRDGLAQASMIPEPGSLVGLPLHPVDFPISLGEKFVGRAERLWELDNILIAMPNEIGSGAHLSALVEGGGGFGKTQIAREYFHRFGPIWYRGGLIWIDASTSDAELEEQFYDALSTLVPDLPPLVQLQQEKLDIRAALGRAIQQRRGEDGFLFVVDNVPEGRGGEPPQPLSKWCPARSHVTMMATSRRSRFEPGLTAFPVDLLDLESSVVLLRCGLAPAEVGELKAEEWKVVAEWAGRLPLVLNLLNRALLVNGGLRARTLLDYATKKKSVTAAGDEQREVLRSVVADKDLRGVTEAFAVSYEWLPEDLQRAVRLLAWFAPAAVPEKIIESLCGTNVKTIDLLSRSFLEKSGRVDGASTWTMHRVLSDFLRSQGGDNEWIEAIEILKPFLDRQACVDPVLRNFLLSFSALVDNWIEKLPNGLLESPSEVADLMAAILFQMGQDLYYLGMSSGEIQPFYVSVRSFETSLSFLDKERVPDIWALTQNSWGMVLQALGRRKHELRLLHKARGAYEAALSIFSKEQEPGDWAMAQNNLGGVLLILGDFLKDAGFLQEARQAMEASLTVHGKQQHPVRWAASQINLGQVLSILGELQQDVDILRESRISYNAALSVLCENRESDYWATAQDSLGIVLQHMGEIGRDVNLLTEARNAFEASLRARSRERIPDSWAGTQTNLGGIFMILGECQSDAELLEKARDAYEAALLVYTEDRYPDRHRVASSGLARTLRILANLKKSTD